MSWRWNVCQPCCQSGCCPDSFIQIPEADVDDIGGAFPGLQTFEGTGPCSWATNFAYDLFQPADGISCPVGDEWVGYGRVSSIAAMSIASISSAGSRGLLNCFGPNAYLPCYYTIPKNGCAILLSACSAAASVRGTTGGSARMWCLSGLSPQDIVVNQPYTLSLIGSADEPFPDLQCLNQVTNQIIDAGPSPGEPWATDDITVTFVLP